MTWVNTVFLDWSGSLPSRKWKHSVLQIGIPLMQETTLPEQKQFLVRPNNCFIQIAVSVEAQQFLFSCMAHGAMPTCLQASVHKTCSEMFPQTQHMYW